MKFIRENLFLVVLGGAVIVLGALLLVVRMSLMTDVEAQVADRAKISAGLATFANQKISEEVVKAARDRVTTIRTESNRVVGEQIAKSREAYPVLRLQAVYLGKVMETLDAFPIKPDLYMKYGLKLNYANTHRQEAMARLKTMKIAPLPTPEQIAVASRQEFEETRSKRSVDANDAPPVVTPTGEFEVPAVVVERATAKLTAKLAMSARIYVDDNEVVNEITFPAQLDSNISDVTIWRKQYKLWVASDVINAINAANDDVLKPLSAGEQSTLNSAVKRWIAISVDDDYFMLRSEKGATPIGVVGAAGSPAEAALKNIDYSPTQRQTSQDIDVLHYKFTVVMPSRHVLLLARKLMENKYHTVLQVAMTGMDDIRGNYYYGNEPVVLVTFNCEFLMLSTWERDLVPVEYLQRMPPAALRDKDRQLIKGK